MRGLGRNVLAALGVLVLLLIGLEPVAALLEDVHIDGPSAHLTGGRPQALAPHRLRVVKEEFHSPQVNIDVDGLRTEKRSGRQFDDWDPQRHNVFIFGGAGAFGWGLDDGDTLSVQLESLARKSGLPWRVYNMGITDYSIHDELPLLIDQLREGRIPSAVVFFDGVNESGRATPDSSWTTDEALLSGYMTGDYEYFWVADLVERGQRANLDQLYLAKLWRRFIRRIGFLQRSVPERAASLEAQTAHASAAATAYAQYARMVHALGTDFGYDSLFILQPVAGCVTGGAAYAFPRPLPVRPWQVTYIPLLYKAVIGQAPAGLNIADLCPEMSAAMASGLKPFNAPLHLSPEGTGFVARWIFERMQQPSGARHSS